jgi:hypothetical protein
MKNIKMKVSIKSKENTGIIKPGPVYATNGGFTGEVNLQWDAIEKANNYIIEMSRNGAAWYQVDIVVDPQYSLQGLAKGKTYFFRVSAMLKGKRSGWSKAAVKKIK